MVGDGDRTVDELTARRTRAYENFIADVDAAKARLDREVGEIDGAIARLTLPAWGVAETLGGT